MKIHELKILPDFFEEVWEGNKTCEIRDSSDRDFQKGDTIVLRESGGQLRIIELEITHILSGWGLKENYVVLSFKILEKN